MVRVRHHGYLRAITYKGRTYSWPPGGVLEIPDAVEAAGLVDAHLELTVEDHPMPSMHHDVPPKPPTKPAGRAAPKDKEAED